MRTRRLLVAAALVAAAIPSLVTDLHAQRATRRVVLQAPVERQVDRLERDVQIVQLSGRSVVRVWQDYSLPSGESVRDIAIVDGTARIDGEVWGDVVTVFGPVTLGDTAVIHGSLVVVAGSATIKEGARVTRDLVVVGGTVDAPPSFFPGGQHVIVGATSLGDRLRAVLPWVSSGLLLGRLIVPSLAWMWALLAMVLVVTLAVNLLLHDPITRSAEVLAARPFSTFFAGLMMLLLTGPISLLLAASVVGIAVVPFFLCAVVVGWVAGQVSVARWIGRSISGQGSPETRLQGVRSTVIGFVAVTLLYMVPVVGVISWSLVTVFGLGAATLTVIASIRRERPKAAKPSRQGEPPVTPPASEPPLPPAPSDFGPSTPPVAPSATFASAADVSAAPPPFSGAPDLGASGVGAPPIGAAAASFRLSHPRIATAGTDLRAFPRATFFDRLAAGAVDVALVLIANGLFVPFLIARRDEFVFLLMLAYFVAFWAWKQTTIGGIVCNLRVTRVDAAPLGAAEALVRGLASIFSFIALGLGFFWILRDPERQAWHDKVAGTLVVKVPSNWPLD